MALSAIRLTLTAPWPSLSNCKVEGVKERVAAVFAVNESLTDEPVNSCESTPHTPPLNMISTVMSPRSAVYCDSKSSQSFH